MERIKELDRQCTEARAAKLKPLQDAMVEKCVKEDEKPRDYCERFYSDYGWGSAAGGFRNPRFFEDIPECEAAFEARKNRER